MNQHRRIVSRSIAKASMLLASFGIISMASATTIKISEEQVAPMADYNILLFNNLRLDIVGLFGVTYDDNINTAENDPEDSFYVTPRLRIAIDWPITPHIQIGSSIDLGYRYHITGDGNDTFYAGLSGDLSTGIKADIILGNGVLRIYDDFERQADTIELGGRVGDNEYVLNRNTIGLHYRVPLTPYVNLKATLDHRNSWTNLDAFSSHDNVRDRFHVVTSWEVNPQLRLGPYYQWQRVEYDKSLNNNRQSSEFGFSFLYKTESSLSFDGSVGYEIMDIDSSPLAQDEKDGFVGRFAIRYASSEFTDHTISVAHDRDQDILNPSVNFSEETRYMYAIASEVRPGLILNGDISLLDIEESDSGENAKLWRFGLGTSYELGPRDTISLRYTFYDKNSDITNRDFERNVFTVTLVHDF